MPFPIHTHAATCVLSSHYTEVAQRLLAIQPPPDAGELRQELERHLQQALRLPAIESAAGNGKVGGGDASASISGGGEGAAATGGAEAGASTSEDAAAAADGGDAMTTTTTDVGGGSGGGGGGGAAATAGAAATTSFLTSTSPEGESLDVLPPMMVAREVADVLTVKQGDVRPSSMDSTIPTIALPSVAPLLPGGLARGEGGRRSGRSSVVSGKSGKSNGGGGGGGGGSAASSSRSLSLKMKTTGGSSSSSSSSSKNFIVSGKEPKRHAGYPKFGTGVIKERGFANINTNAGSSSSSSHHNKLGFSKLGEEKKASKPKKARPVSGGFGARHTDGYGNSNHAGGDLRSVAALNAVGGGGAS